MMTVQNVCFTITGQFITQHARDLVKEEAWEDAVRFLKTSIIGFTYDNVIDVLSGTHELIGKNDIQLRHRCDVEYMQFLDEKYAHFVYVNRKWYIPYCFITSYGPPDWKFRDTSAIYGSTTPLSASDNQFTMCRAGFYTNTKRDLIYCLKCPDGRIHMTVFTPSEITPPVWMDVNKSPQDAVNVYGKRLPEDGFCIRFPNYDFSQYHKEKEKETFERVIIEEYEKKKDINLFAEDQIPVEVLAPVDTKLFGHWGWVAPTGEFYSCSYGGHIFLAENLAKHLYPESGIVSDSSMFHNNTERYLEVKGWIKIGGGGKQRYYAKDDSITPTQSQHDTLWDWCKKHEEKFPKYLFSDEVEDE